MRRNSKQQPTHTGKKRTGQAASSGSAGTKKWTLKVVLLTVLAILVLTAAAVVVYVGVNMVKVVYGDLVVNLDEYKANQNQTTIVYGKNAANEDVEIARLHGTENRIWVSLDDMPDELGEAAIALEDKRFPKHHGVDWFRTISVIVRNTDSGGSTITQQLIKNLTGNREVTYSRKYNEILSALNLERYYDKNVILEAYLNTLYLGEGCYSVKTAAEVYFGKDVSELNAAECACLVSITQKPTLYDPLINPEDNRERQLDCLQKMYEEGYLTEQEYDDAVNYKMVFTNSPDYVADGDDAEDTAVQEIQSYYVDYVIDKVIDDLCQIQGYTESQATDMIYYGGLKIYTAVDVDVQAAMEEVFTSRSGMDHSGAQAGMAVMDYSGRIVGLVGGAGEKTERRGLNRATDIQRQMGSSIKPLSVYGPGIDTGKIYWSSIYEDSPIYKYGELWPEQNAGGGYSGSKMTVQYGLQHSINMIAGRVLDTVGLDTSYEYATNNFGLPLHSNDKDWSPLAMGSTYYGVSPLDMAAAFATFGNGGVYYEPYCYYKVTDRTGKKTYLETESKSHQAISAGTADVMNELLQTVVNGGTGNGYAVSGFQTFAKTGTTNDNKDRWFCGGTPYYVGAVWYGYDVPENLGSTSSPNKIFKNVMDRIHEGKDAKTFTKSKESEQKEYCTVTGLLASDKCTNKQKGWFVKGKEPDVCTQCGGGAPAEGNTTPQVQQ